MYIYIYMIIIIILYYCILLVLSLINAVSSHWGEVHIFSAGYSLNFGPLGRWRLQAFDATHLAPWIAMDIPNRWMVPSGKP